MKKDDGTGLFFWYASPVFRGEAFKMNEYEQKQEARKQRYSELADNFDREAAHGRIAQSSRRRCLNG